MRPCLFGALTHCGTAKRKSREPRPEGGNRRILTYRRGCGTASAATLKGENTVLRTRPAQMRRGQKGRSTPGTPPDMPHPLTHQKRPKRRTPDYWEKAKKSATSSKKENYGSCRTFYRKSKKMSPIGGRTELSTLFGRGGSRRNTHINILRGKEGGSCHSRLGGRTGMSGNAISPADPHREKADQWGKENTSTSQIHVAAKMRRGDLTKSDKASRKAPDLRIPNGLLQPLSKTDREGGTVSTRESRYTILSSNHSGRGQDS